MKNLTDPKKEMPLWVALAIILIAVPLRVVQYMHLIDASTGFYNTIDATIIILYGILGAGIIYPLIASYIKHNTIQPLQLCEKSVIFTVISIIFAITLVIDSVVQIGNFLEMFGTSAFSSAVEIKQYISQQGGMLLLLQAILGGLCGIYFTISGVIVGLGNADSSKLKILALLPTIWCIFRLLYRFKRTISFVNVSDLLIELFFIVFSMMFFFAVAQVNSKIDVNGSGKESDFLKSTYWKIFGYGIPAIILATVCFLPRFILLISGNSDHINTHYPVNASDFGFILFAVYTCISGYKSKNADED